MGELKIAVIAGLIHETVMNQQKWIDRIREHKKAFNKSYLTKNPVQREAAGLHIMKEKALSAANMIHNLRHGSGPYEGVNKQTLKVEKNNTLNYLKQLGKRYQQKSDEHASRFIK
jgi:hypothetical protein